MPQLDYMILCDVAYLDRGKLHMLGAGIDVVRVLEFPTAHNAGVALRLLLTRAECNRKHEVEIIFQDEDGQQLLQAKGEVSAAPPSDLPPGVSIGAAIAFMMPLALPHPGTYSLELLINGSSVKSIPVLVRKHDPLPSADG